MGWDAGICIFDEFHGCWLHLLIKVRGHLHFFSSNLKFQTLIRVLCTPSFREQKFPVAPDSFLSFSVFSALWFMKEKPKEVVMAGTVWRTTCNCPNVTAQAECAYHGDYITNIQYLLPILLTLSLFLKNASFELKKIIKFKWKTKISFSFKEPSLP